MILEENTTTFFGGKQVDGLMFDVVASNVLRIIGVAAEKRSRSRFSPRPEGT